RQQTSRRNDASAGAGFKSAGGFRRPLRSDEACLHHRSGRQCPCAAFGMGDQRAISALTRRLNAAGLRSSFAGIEAPRLARRFATEGSSRALSSATEILPTISFATPLGAKTPAQISRSYLSPISFAEGTLGNAGKRSGAETT